MDADVGGLRDDANSDLEESQPEVCKLGTGERRGAADGAAPGEGNLEDRIALPGENAAKTPAEREVSLRPLRHLASSVRRERYRDAEFLTVCVGALDRGSGPPP